MTVRNWLTKLLGKSNKVEQAFFVKERDKGDYNNLHVHILIDTNTDMSYQEVKYGLGNVSVGDYQPIYDSEQVYKYVTKHIGKDVDYDIVFKSLNFSGIFILNIRAWVLENGFSIGSGGWDLICNLIFEIIKNC